MKEAQNSDSKTHVKKLNLTSRTEIGHKSLKYLFLETPCTQTASIEMLSLCAYSNLHCLTTRQWFSVLVLFCSLSCLKLLPVFLCH